MAESLLASKEWPPRDSNESSIPTTAVPSTCAKSTDTARCVGVWASRRSVTVPLSGAGSASRSILPCGVMGISSSTTYAAGIM
ncbi:Uncharacterised protein [Mycobacteroides abscessus subsp. abscessus]|nr:Uncharacterised protein [Mycobacteroides abscessus subsp. abscessus]